MQFPYGAVHVGRDSPHVEFGDPKLIEPQYAKPEAFVQDFRKRLKINIISLTENDIVFDLIGVDASIANALRRILIAEVPTMAIEHVYIWNNSSIIQDEVLAHRLGLIPIKVDPREFEPFPEHEEAEPTDLNTIVFKLVANCTRRKGSIDRADDPANTADAINAKVYSRHLEWVPQGGQQDKYAENPIKPVHDDILIAKLKPGQGIALEAHCRKGIGKDHAKFSPVSTASYRLQPHIVLKEEIRNELAEELVEKCPMNVYDIEDLGKGQKRGIVARPRDCTMCRECIRGPGWSDRVKLMRRKDHFIFSVESVGMYKPQELVREALKILIEKCDSLLEHMDQRQRSMEQE